MSTASHRFVAPGTIVSPAFRALRWLSALLLLAGVVFLFMKATEFRAAEARMVAAWLNPLIEGGVRPQDTYFFVSLRGSELIAFNVTMECTALLLVSPLAVVTALLLMFTKLSALRTFWALAASVTVAFVMNQSRLGLIAWMTQTWGMDVGYEMGHRFIGSLIALLAFAVGFLILLWIAFRAREGSQGPQPARRRQQT